MQNQPISCPSASRSAAVLCLFALSALLSLLAVAESPGDGRTAPFEVRYLKSIADHHYSALRMTELAAGTDHQREPTVCPIEGKSPTPDTQPVQAKAALDELKSLARRNNRIQREEILTALGFLQDWYGIHYEPRVRRVSKAQIALIENEDMASSFDHLFIEVLSRHHFSSIAPIARCQVASDVTHIAALTDTAR